VVGLQEPVTTDEDREASTDGFLADIEELSEEEAEALLLDELGSDRGTDT
jgi:hypothetical protein